MGLELRRQVVVTELSALGKEEVCEGCRWQHENKKQKTPEQFNQG